MFYWNSIEIETILEGISKILFSQNNKIQSEYCEKWIKKKTAKKVVKAKAVKIPTKKKS